MFVKKARLENFDDWVDYFHAWHDDIGYPMDLIGNDYKFETKLAEIESNEIEFGDYTGRPKWEKLTDVPDQRIRDALAHLIEFQGDTEFASVEQQRNLIERAPTDVDLKNLIRINREEMRHGLEPNAAVVPLSAAGIVRAVVGIQISQVADVPESATNGAGGDVSSRIVRRKRQDRGGDPHPRPLQGLLASLGRQGV